MSEAKKLTDLVKSLPSSDTASDKQVITLTADGLCKEDLLSLKCLILFGSPLSIRKKRSGRVLLSSIMTAISTKEEWYSEFGADTLPGILVSLEFTNIKDVDTTCRLYFFTLDKVIDGGDSKSYRYLRPLMAEFIGYKPIWNSSAEISD